MGSTRQAAVLFGVRETTARRTFITMLNAVVFIMGNHKPWPTSTAAFLATPDKSRSDLGLEPSTAVFLADAVEREIERPRAPDLQYATFSDYKQTTTLKFNAVAAGNGYMCEYSRGYPGRLRDNRIILGSGVGERLAGDKSRPVALLYDKGFTQFQHVEKHKVLVLTPRGKRRNQFDFTADGAHNKNVSVYRAPIETLFAHCRNYEAFDGTIRLSGIDLAELVAEAVRCEVNLTVCPHGWQLTTDSENFLSMSFAGFVNLLLF